MAASTTAAAHTLLVDPPPISNNDGAKAGPCGCKFGGDPACPASFPTTELIAGDTVTIKWKETVQHTGSFRLAFSTKDPDQVTGADLDANVMYDKADANNTAGGMISTSLTVPNTPCNPCTLQLRQFMEGAASPYYYSCASVRIVDPSSSNSSSSASSAEASSGAGGDPTGGSGAGAGNSGQGGDFDGEGGSTGPGLATPPNPIQTGSCTAGQPQPGGLTLSSNVSFAALVSIGLLARARRKRAYR